MALVEVEGPNVQGNPPLLRAKDEEVTTRHKARGSEPLRGTR